MRIGVVGLGRVGLVTAVAWALHGHEVRGFDVDARRAAAVRAGRVPFHEPDLPEALERARARLSVVASAAEAGRGADVVFLCLPVPARRDGRADLRALAGAARDLAPGLAPGAVVAVKSTVPPGTAERVEAWLRAAGAPPDVEVASVPEFLREGSALADALRPDRVVLGADTPRARERLRALYEPLGAPVLLFGRRSAELTKLAANAFLAARLSLVNLLADLCDAAGADVDHVVRALGLDPRIGPAYLRPGAGYGGSCLPKDVRLLTRLLADAGLDGSLPQAVARINRGRPARLLRLAEAALERFGTRLDGAAVAVLGLAFKPHTDDVRGTPARPLVTALLRRGCRVTVHDPVALPAFARVLPPTAGWRAAATPAAALGGADVAMVLTDWPEYVGGDWAAWVRRMRRPLVVDGRHALDPGALAAAGAVLLAPGRAGVAGAGAEPRQAGPSRHPASRPATATAWEGSA